MADLASVERDRSKKGGVDLEALPLLDAINANSNLYTTSSCAGRIVLFVEPESGKKHEGQWLYVSHSIADEKDVIEHIKVLPNETVWFRMEGAILHVCARDLDAASKFLELCREAGWKHSGITGTKRVMIEATTSERIDVPISKDGALFIEEKFLGFLVREANTKLSKTREKLNRLREKFYQ